MSLIAELKRRNVFRVAVAYLALAWLIIESASVLLPGFGVPDWAFRFVVIILALGFVPALVFSWAYEVTPEGLKRDSEAVRDDTTKVFTARRLDLLTIGMVVVALAIIVFDRFWLSPRNVDVVASPAEIVADESQESAADLFDTIDSIAVLPFANRSANPEDAFFVDGIHDDLLIHISQINALKTISRTSVMQYRDSTLSVPDIAGELGVAVILEGAVQRAGEQVRINVQLIDARTDDHIWAEVYDRQLTASNIFAIQTEIAESIAAALQATLTPTARERIERIPTENLEALEAYFLGRQSMTTRRVEDLRRAADHLEEAVALDPGFALAHANLADTYLLLGGYFGMDMNESIALSATAAERALAIDPGLGAAHASVAKRLSQEGDSEAADASFRRAIELSPNYAPAYQWYGELLRGFEGRIDEALEMSRRAMELDPKSAIIVLDHGEVLERAGRPDEALHYYRQSVEIEPMLETGHRAIGRVLATRLGQMDDALAVYEKLIRSNPGDTNTVRLIGLIFLELGDWQQAAFWHSRLRVSDGRPPDFEIAMEMRRGNSEAALSAARRNLESRLVSPAALRLLRDEAIANGDFALARRIFEQAHPELFDLDSLQVDWRNREAAVDLAYLLLLTDAPDHAELLLEGSEAAIAWGAQLWTLEAFPVLQARIDALRGDSAAAVGSLRHAADHGWRLHVRYFLESDPVLAPLHGDAEFEQLKAEIESDMAEQLARVQQRGILADFKD